MTAPSCDSRGDSCHLCGDEAVVGRVMDIDHDNRTAIVRSADGDAVVALDLVDASVGDALLVHLGFAIERVESA